MSDDISSFVLLTLNYFCLDCGQMGSGTPTGYQSFEGGTRRVNVFSRIDLPRYNFPA